MYHFIEGVKKSGEISRRLNTYDLIRKARDSKCPISLAFCYHYLTPGLSRAISAIPGMGYVIEGRCSVSARPITLHESVKFLFFLFILT